MSAQDDWRRRKAEELGLIQTGPTPARRGQANTATTSDLPDSSGYRAHQTPPPMSRGPVRAIPRLAGVAAIGLAMLFGWWLRGAATPVDIGRAMAAAPVVVAPADSAPVVPDAALPPVKLPEPAPVMAASPPHRALASRPRRAAGPSFHCRGEMPTVNRMICDNRRLLALDVRMSAAYGDAIATAGNNGRRRIEAAQTRFLNRRAQCDTAACLDRVYRNRIAQLIRRR